MAEGSEPMRPRTRSFDLHLLMHHHKIMKFSKLFRSRSDTNVKSSPRTSPSPSPRASPGAPPRRRFMRVVRDEQSSGEEYENPHLIRKYTQKYAETLCLKKSQSLDGDTKTLPYTTSGHTILKKFSSFEQTASANASANATPDHSPPSSKHASFREEVEVIEYDKKEKIQKQRFLSHRERISFDEIEDELGLCSLDEDEELSSLAECPLDERDEYDAGDEAEHDKGVPAEPEVFSFDEDEEGLSSPVAAAGAGSPVISRQLSSDSDSSDCDRPSRKKKSKIADLRDTVADAEHTKGTAQETSRRKIEVES